MCGNVPKRLKKKKKGKEVPQKGVEQQKIKHARTY